MKILDNDYTVKDKAVLTVFKENKKIIKALIYNNFATMRHLEADIEQDCLYSYIKFYSKYDYQKGVIIGKWLKMLFYHTIIKVWKKEKQYLYPTEVKYDLKPTVFYDYQVKNMAFAALLTDEQIKILQFILDGYDYSEIFDLVGLSNKTTDKVRPVYRRVAKIKEILAGWYEIPFITPQIY